MNYGLLLTRSIDFDPFANVLYPAYPDELTRPLLLSLIRKGTAFTGKTKPRAAAQASS